MATRKQLALALLTISGVPSGVKLDELNTFILQTSSRQCWIGRGEIIESEETVCKWVVALNTPGHNATLINTVKKAYFPYRGNNCAITFEETKPDNVPEAYLTSPDQRNQSVPQGMFPGYNTLTGQYPPQMYQGQQVHPEIHPQVQPEGHRHGHQVQPEGHYQGQQVPPMEHTLQSQKQDHHSNDEQDADDNLYTDAVSTLETAAEKEQRQDLPTREMSTCIVVVETLAKKASKKDLEKYFRNMEKSGGEREATVELKEDEGKAFVTFSSAEVARTVAQKTHVLKKKQMEVKLHVPENSQVSSSSESSDEDDDSQSTTDEDTEPIRTITVQGFSPDTTDENLELYFESKKRSDGGLVESVTFNTNKDVAYVTFESDEAAARVVERTHHTLKNQTLLVGRFDPAQENEDLSLEDDELARRTIEVTGFKSSSTSSELLEMYFENKRKSGGGPFEQFEFSDDGTIFVVTFQLEDVAQRVLEKESHIVEGHALTVTQQQGDNSGGDEKVDVSRTVKVTWSMESENIEKDNLELYFESKRYSGGENIEELVLLEDDDEGYSRAARITFETKEETQRVIQKMKHTLSGTQLCVTQYYPAPKHKGNRKSAGEQEIWGATGNKTKNQSGTKEKQEPVCTVRVKGFPVGKATDTLVYYFENTKTSGGGEVLDSKVVEDEEAKDVFLILTFQTEEVAKRVVAREKHTVDGHSLTVVLYIPPPPVPFMENYIFISNLRSTTTKECLANFLEAKSQVVPERFIYGEKEGTVVVVFEEPPDVDKLQETCRKQSLENVHLNIERVPYTSCVQVTEFADTTTPDTLKFYFENKRRSSGGEVRKVKKLDKDCFLVYFEDYQVVDEVTKRRHEIEKANLKVQPFMECLGRFYGDDTQPSIKIPEAITIEEIDLDKLKFIENHEKMKDAFEKQLNDCHAKIVWSTPVVIECTLTEKVKNARKLAADWAKNCQDSLNHFMSTLDVHTFPVLEIWEEVKKGLTSIDIQEHEPVAVVMEKKKELIKVVGVSHFAGSLRKQVQEIVNRVREKKELEKQRVSETKTDLQPLKLRMLLSAKFPTNMENAFENLKVKISQRSNRNEINFDGVQVDVQGALLKMFENMAAFAERRVPDVSKYCLILYQKKPVKEYIVKKLKNQNCIGVWEATNVSLTVCTLNESLDACVELIQGCLAEKAIITAPPARKILSSEQWVEKVDEIHKRSTDMSVVYTEKDFTKVIVASTDDIHDEIVSSIEKFLKNNTILEETVNMGGGVVRFLKMNHKTDFKKIETDYSQHNVSITAFEEDQYISIRGTQEGIQYAKAAVTALANKVKSKEHEFEKPRLGYWVTSSKGKESVKQVEGQHGCAIEIKGQRRSNVTVKDRREGATSGSTNMSRSQDGSGPLIHATCTAFDDHMVYTVEGDMTELLVDVMVNTADSKLTMTGGLAKAIIRKGGKMIEKECEDFVRDNGSLDEGDVFCSTPGRLSCSMIVHVVGPHWDSGNRGEKEALKQTVFRSMVQANKGRLTSIAIPAISCGLYGYPAREATKVISNTIKDFFREEQDSSLVEVYLCDVKPQTVEHFTEALGNAFGKGYITYVPKTPRKGAAAMGGNSSDDSGDEDSLPRQVQRDQQETLMSLGKISVKIYKDEMAKQQVDVIVNTTARNLDLKNGAVSASLLKAGGPGLQQEVSANFPKGLSRDGEIAMTGGANLNCKYVFHSCLGNWADAESAKTLQGLVVECLQRAHAKNATSIALPAIGTGNLNFPRDIVAERMFKSVAVFSEANPKTSLKEVRFILYFKDHPTIKAFEAEERKWTGGQRMGQRRGRGGMESSSDQVSSKISRKEEKEEEEEEDGESSEDDNGQDDFVARDVKKTGNNRAECQFGSILVKIRQGDITRDTAQCIVNSSNQELDLTRGAVSSAILKFGGDKLKAEAQKLAPSMKQDSLVMTNAYRMPCQKIIHLVAQNNAGDWEDIIEKCLVLAERNKIKSLAFPALGTAMNIPPSEIAEALFATITKFEKTHPASVQEISVVIFQQTMVNDFIVAMQKKPRTLGETIYGKVKDGFEFVFGKSSKKPKRQKQTAKGTSSQLRQRRKDKVVFVLFATKTSVFDNVVKRLMKIIEESIIQREINDEIICKFSPDKVKMVKEIGDKTHVDISTDILSGVIKVTGLVENVIAAKDALHPLIVETYKLDQQRSKADMLANLIQWLYMEVTDTGTEVKPYDKDINCQLEEAYTNQDPSCSFVDSGDEFIIDFKTMEEHPKDSPKDVVKVIRRLLTQESSSTKLPDIWTKMNESDNLMVVTLQKTDKEWTDVETEFKTSAGQNWTITEIKRIQNKFMYQQYEVKKKFLEQQNGKSIQNERILWHGTAPEVVDSINAQGFNRSFCGKNATVFGDGVYFAVSASYSCRPTYSRPDPNGVKRIYRCKVLTGQYTIGKGGMRVPPIRKDHENFDSVSDNLGTPGMFIIFNDTQAYPEYLIAFK